MPKFCACVPVKTGTHEAGTKISQNWASDSAGAS